MRVPKRLQKQAGRYALVDGIPLRLPVECRNSSVLMAIFPIDPDAAKKLIPAMDIHPLRLWNRGLLVVTVINYKDTNIGQYIEYSIAIACTHSARPAPRLLSTLFRKYYNAGQYVYDMPVSTEISTKGGKGIWGMPKHQASLNFIVERERVSSQYDLDGEFATYIEIKRPKWTPFPVNMSAANYCAFRGMLMRSQIYFKGQAGFSFFKKNTARFIVGDHPRVQPLKSLNIGTDPIMTAFFPTALGILDDYFENWFLSYRTAPSKPPEGMESVIDMGLGQEWPPAPKSPVPK